MGKHRSPNTKAVGVKTSPRKAAAISPKALRPTLLQPFLSQVRRNDVVFGRGPTICSLEGNLQFRSFVCKFKEKYQSAPKKGKQYYIDAIIEKVHELDPPGRFLEFKGDDLHVVSRATRVYEKVSQALRDKKNCEPTSFLRTYKKQGDSSKHKVAVGEVSEEVVSLPTSEGVVIPVEVIPEKDESTSVAAMPSRRKSAVWPPPPTEKETRGKLGAINEGVEPCMEKKASKNGKASKSSTKKNKTPKVQAVGGECENRTVEKHVSSYARITIRCGEWSAPFGSNEGCDSLMALSTDETTDVVSNDAADEVMNDDSIWGGPGVFELLQFPTEASMVESTFLELDAAEIVPVCAKAPVVADCVPIEPDLVLPSTYSEGSRIHGAGQETTGVGKSMSAKSTDRVFSEWGEGTGDLLDYSGCFAQVFSSEFETEVASMVSNNEEDKDGPKFVSDNSVPQVPIGIAFMCATSSVFFAGGVPPPTNYRPEIRDKTPEGPGGMAGPYSLLELAFKDRAGAFKDRAEALEAARNCLVTM